MQIFNNNFINSNNYRQNNSNNVSFGMLKKSQIKDCFDLAFVNSYKPPIEKFKSIDEINLAAKKIFNEKYLPNTGKVGLDNNLAPWKKFVSPVENPRFSGNYSLSLLIMSGFEKMHHIPIVVEKVLNDTIGQVQKMLDTTPRQFNFIKQYLNNMEKTALNKYFPNQENPTGWIKIPSMRADAKNYTENLKTLNELSSNTKWCTLEPFFAKECLNDGDFYIYIKDGKTALAVRTKDLEGKAITTEIKNKLNENKYDALKPALDELYSKYPNVKFYKDNSSWVDW